jgi:hypothetical protein
MRGKKVDSEFVSDFISHCVGIGVDTTEGIIQQAQNNIREIDEEIKKVEKQKVVRSKLLDVISTFDRPNKTNKSEEIRALSFFKIQHPQICQNICRILKSGPTTIEGLGSHYPTPDVLFCVKQLLEHKVISKSGAHLLRGEAFDEYLKFALQET